MPAKPVPAATVILVREGDVSPEVLMIERHSSSEFLPDLYVFPGGRVEDQDSALADRVTGVAADTLAALSRAEALAFLVAAIRETFEESGILLARRRGEPETLQPHEAKEVAAHRLELQAGKISFREVIEQHDLELATDQLAMHAHWITPEPVPRRFDTLFFTVLAPAGQQARHDGVETTDHLWIRPEDALAEMRAGERRIIFPTAMNLETLRGFSSAEEVLEASRKRRVVPITPALEERGGRRFIVIPPDAGYPYHEAPVDQP